nr:MAG TPA: hypothetical protein [Caudoviricetes sp.]
MNWQNETMANLYDSLYDLCGYYSDATGRAIDFGIDTVDDFWIRSHRTNDKEYFESVDEVERRLKLLYSDVLPEDWDDVDLLDGI